MADSQTVNTKTQYQQVQVSVLGNFIKNKSCGYIYIYHHIHLSHRNKLNSVIQKSGVKVNELIHLNVNLSVEAFVACIIAISMQYFI